MKEERMLKVESWFDQGYGPGEIATRVVGVASAWDARDENGKRVVYHGALPSHQVELMPLVGLLREAIAIFLYGDESPVGPTSSLREAWDKALEYYPVVAPIGWLNEHEQEIKAQLEKWIALKETRFATEAADLRARLATA